MPLSQYYSVWIDESEKGKWLAVGGFWIPLEKQQDLITAWENMKKSFDLSKDAEIKWHFHERHPVRKELESKGKKTKHLLEKATKIVQDFEHITCVVCVIKDERKNPFWKRKLNNLSPRDFYCEAFKYVLQRVAEDAEYEKWGGLLIICDTPSTGGKKAISLGAIKRGHKAVFNAYRNYYKNGVGIGPSKKFSDKALRDLNFQPSILISDATYHDLLQIADIIVGCTLAWVDCVEKGEHSRKQWVIEQFKKISNKFRSKYGNPSFWGDGLIIWPWQHELWKDLQNSLKETIHAC